VLCELNVCLEDLRRLVRARKVLCDEGVRSLLQALEAMRSAYVRTMLNPLSFSGCIDSCWHSNTDCFSVCLFVW
jgi:hypothetical protein